MSIKCCFRFLCISSFEPTLFTSDPTLLHKISFCMCTLPFHYRLAHDLGDTLYTTVLKWVTNLRGFFFNFTKLKKRKFLLYFSPRRHLKRKSFVFSSFYKNPGSLYTAVHAGNPRHWICEFQLTAPFARILWGINWI